MSGLSQCIISRFAIKVIPLSILALVSAVSGCTVSPIAESVPGYSVPPKQSYNVLDYRDFGFPSKWNELGILIGKERIKGLLMADMRLLMQLGVRSDIYKVNNRNQNVEYWLIANGFGNRNEAREVTHYLLKSGMWSQPISLISMPVNDSLTRVVDRTP